MNHHELKILPEHYNNVKAGTKTFEIRVNDRGYQKGDKVSLFYFPKDAGTKTLSWYTHEQRPCLQFIIGDVYPIDSERVVFSLLNEAQNAK